jgi:thymidylate kinase
VILEHRQGLLILLSAERLLAGRRKRGEFWIPDPAAEFVYLLLKKVLKRELPERQRDRLQSLAGELGAARVEALTEPLFGKRPKKLAARCCLDGSLSLHLGRLRRALWTTMLLRHPLNPVRHLAANLQRLVRRWCRPAGYFVALLGPDGAGKSTLAANLAAQLEDVFRSSRRHHWRPNLLWRRGGEMAAGPPHERPAHSSVWSTIRLGAYSLDYWLGYWLRIRPALARAGLVIFDRYFEDLLADPARYRYGGSSGLVRALARVVPRPDFSIVLDAPEDTILLRKQEVAVGEISRQRRVYRELAAGSPAWVRVDASAGPHELSAHVARLVVSRLAERFRRRHSRSLHA